VSSRNASYHEALLHWIWKNRYFDVQQLQTNDGKQIRIHHPGQLNKSDGPDFTNAKITIGTLRWYGDVEIHWKCSDWHAHDHHTDSNFNNVVLHVVFQETDKKSVREDNTSVPTFCLSKYLSEPLHAFLNQYQNQPELPCAGQLSFISKGAFTKQLEKAHKEYFEQKTDDLLEFYDPILPPSQAWVKMFSIALFDGLGISHNREPMQILATKLIDRISDISSQDGLREQAIQISGINDLNSSLSNITWKHKGCRPGNHPRPRIHQGVEALWYIYNLPFERWMQKDPHTLWKKLINSITVTPSIGRERSSILFGTVFLPALYSLGNLFFSDRLKSRSWNLWCHHRAHIPKSLLKRLDKTDIPASVYAQKLGAIYQLRSYCQPRNCQKCKVFKSAISS
jgi:hypothetical protein